MHAGSSSQSPLIPSNKTRPSSHQNPRSSVISDSCVPPFGVHSVGKEFGVLEAHSWGTRHRHRPRNQPSLRAKRGRDTPANKRMPPSMSVGNVGRRCLA
jgi:hypothetical protein